MNAPFDQLPDTVWPLLIILVFTFIPLLIGSAAAQNSVSTISDFFLYNRNMSTQLSFFTIFATWWSSFAFLGSTSYFYSMGSVYWTGIAWNVLFGLSYMWFGLRINRYGRALGYVTPIHFFSDIFHSKAVSILILCIMIFFTVPYFQIQLYGGAIIIDIATNGMIPWQICAFLFYLVMVIYLWAGGLRAVAWADIFYSVLIFGGMLVAGILLVSAAGGVSETFETLSQNRPDLILLTTGTSSSGISIWLSMFFIIPLGALMGPAMWLRMFAPKSQGTFHIMPLLLSLGAIAYLGSMLAGNAGIILKPNIASADTILPLLLFEHAPAWLMVLLLCCGAAACLSTANAELHAISALITLDIYKPYIHKHSSEKHIVLIARITIVAFSAFAYLALVLTETPTSIIQTGFTALGGMAQVAVPTFGALIWRRTQPLGIVLGLIVGLATVFCGSLIPSHILLIHPGLMGLLLNATVFVLCGLLLPENRAIAEKITMYKKGLYH